MNSGEMSGAKTQNMKNTEHTHPYASKKWSKKTMLVINITSSIFLIASLVGLFMVFAQ